MRIILVAVLSVTMTAMTFASQDSAAGAPLVITISVGKQTVNVGDPVPVKIKVTNVSDHPLNLSGGLGNTGLASSHLFEINGPAGRVLSRNALRQGEPLTGDVVFRTLKPGETFTEIEDVGRAYDMTKPGRYVIQLSRPIPDDREHRVVKSNKIAVTVTP
jgi:hypothetical protein